MKKIPIQIILGKNEMENEEVNVRRLGSQESQSLKVEDFINMVVEESKIRFEQIK